MRFNRVILLPALLGLALGAHAAKPAAKKPATKTAAQKSAAQKPASHEGHG